MSIFEAIGYFLIKYLSNLRLELFTSDFQSQSLYVRLLNIKQFSENQKFENLKSFMDKRIF